MDVLCLQIASDFVHLIDRTVGSLQVSVSRVSSPEQASGDALVFASTEAQLRTALERGAGAIILAANLEKHLPELPGAPVLLTPKLTLLLALVLQKYFDPSKEKFHRGPRIDPRAFLSPEAEVGEGAVISAGAFVGPGVLIGAGALIGPGCVVEEGARIGPGTVLHALVFLGHHCEIGARCEIHAHTTLGSDGYSYAHDEQGNHFKIPQLGVVIVEDDVEIGANCTIDRAAFDVTRIGRGTKIDNLCHIAHNCQIGRQVLLTGGFFVAGSSSIGDHCVCGGRTTVTDHVDICAGVQLAGLSAVTKGITVPGAYGGHPPPTHEEIPAHHRQPAPSPGAAEGLRGPETAGPGGCLAPECRGSARIGLHSI